MYLLATASPSSFEDVCPRAVVQYAAGFVLLRELKRAIALNLVHLSSADSVRLFSPWIESGTSVSVCVYI